MALKKARELSTFVGRDVSKERNRLMKQLLVEVEQDTVLEVRTEKEICICFFSKR